MTRAVRIVAIAVIAGLGLPASTSAKSDEVVKICGASACTRNDDPGVVGALHSTFASTSAPEPAPFYVVSFQSDGDRVWSYIYVPSAHAMRSNTFGRGRQRWQDATLLRPDLPDLTQLDPYPANATWHSPAGGVPEIRWVPVDTTASTRDARPWAIPAAVAVVLLAGLALAIRRRRLPLKPAMH